MQSLTEYHRNKVIKIENATFCYGMLHLFLPCNTYFGSRMKNFRGGRKFFERYYFVFFEYFILCFSNDLFYVFRIMHLLKLYFLENGIFVILFNPQIVLCNLKR